MTKSAGTTGEELDERKSHILRSVVAEYIDTAQPVGSSHIVKSAGLDVSSATVRNEMSRLEEEGYLVQPHTSAGRIPTDKGYRFFVDGLPHAGELAGPPVEAVSNFFARTHGELEELLTETSRFLSTLTSYAAVVVGPNHESASIRSAQLVHLGTHSVLAVLVLSDGAVEKHALELEGDITETQVEAASRRITAHLVGRHRNACGAVQPTGDDTVDGIVGVAMTAVTAEVRDEEKEHIVVRGASRMAEAFDAIETVRSVLSILEQQILVVSLLRSVLDRTELTVAIGKEHGMTPLAECAVVAMPCRFPGDEIGVVGVLGPTRMHYEKAMSTVAVVGRQLEARWEESGAG